MFRWRTGGFFAAALAGVAFAATSAHAQVLGPSPYLQFSDSPFSGLTFAQYFHLETFEDNLLNTPGVSASAGAPLVPSGITDSVDGDDGTIDGSGTQGQSFFSGGGSTGISFTFDAIALGSLPTHVGIVWTDGAGTIEFEAFDEFNQLIGGTSATHADGSISGTTAEDRFYGFIAPGGISRIFIRNTSGGIEVDHLQYGSGVASAAPEPGAGILFLLGIPAVVALRRRRQFR
ncbi:MAG: hypothetical protein OHK0029_26490 [Armatimonadaceae bacterium]